MFPDHGHLNSFHFLQARKAHGLVSVHKDNSLPGPPSRMWLPAPVPEAAGATQQQCTNFRSQQQRMISCGSISSSTLQIDHLLIFCQADRFKIVSCFNIYFWVLVKFNIFCGVYWGFRSFLCELLIHRFCSLSPSPNWSVFFFFSS